MRTIETKTAVSRFWIYSGALTVAVVASVIFASFLT